jgi:hypothetical protein
MSKYQFKISQNAQRVRLDPKKVQLKLTPEQIEEAERIQKYLDAIPANRPDPDKVKRL